MMGHELYQMKHHRVLEKCRELTSRAVLISNWSPRTLNNAVRVDYAAAGKAIRMLRMTPRSFAR